MSCSICGDKDWYCKGCIISTYSGINRSESEISRLKAENERLRKALEKIAEDGCVAVTFRGELRDVFCVKTAKEALSEGEQSLKSQ